MNKTIVWSVLVTAGIALSACGTKDEGPGESGPMQMEGDEANESTLGDSATTNDSNDSNDSQDSADSNDSADTGAMSTGPMTTLGFIEDPDGGGISFECDMFAQDCPPGEKCMPWASDGGGSWNATRCSMIQPNPGQPGDECEVEGSGTSGIDSCDLGSMCWDVDGETNTGTCVAMCTGDESNPLCEDPDTFCTIANDGAIVLCLPSCDPILQDCAEGQACYPINDGFACAPDASGEMGIYGDPCEFINVCDPGLACVNPEVVPGCSGAMGCCSELCDLADPGGAMQCSGQGGGQDCVPWYEEGNEPPGYEDVGICAIPA